MVAENHTQEVEHKKGYTYFPSTIDVGEQVCISLRTS